MWKDQEIFKCNIFIDLKLNSNGALLLASSKFQKQSKHTDMQIFLSDQIQNPPINLVLLQIGTYKAGSLISMEWVKTKKLYKNHLYWFVDFLCFIYLNS